MSAVGGAATVLLAGWGTKRARGKRASRFKPFMTWRRRFFILRDATSEETAKCGCTHTLVYYKTQPQPHAE
jgi:hypothetical protein